jgi:hypothetical protein
MVLIHLHIILSQDDARFHLSIARRNKSVELIVQLMHLLMQVVIVVLCICQLLLELNLLSPQDILLMPGFIPLMQHMDKHALTVPMRKGQVLLLLP